MENTKDHVKVSNFITFRLLHFPEFNKFVFCCPQKTYVNNPEVNSPYHWKMSLSSVIMAHLYLRLNPLSGQ